jgi:4'-phosphopantetheinyl transferase
MIEFASCRPWQASISKLTITDLLNGGGSNLNFGEGNTSVQIWIFPVSHLPGIQDICYELLTREEIKKAECFKHDGAKAQYVQAHAALNYLLSSYLNSDYNRILRKTTEHKKPYIEFPDGNCPVQFNLSHCADAIAIALSNCPVGVDIEVIRPLNDLKGIANQVFTQAEKQLLFSKPTEKTKLNQFYKYWTCKEAVMKANGTGFMVDPKTIELLDDANDSEERTVVWWTNSIPQHYLAWSLTQY